MSSFFTHNWEYKIIALVLAVVLYFYTNDQISIDHTVIVDRPQPDDIELGDNFTITELRFDPDIDQVRVQLRGPKGLIEQVGNTLALELEPRNLSEGQQTYALNHKTLGIDPKLEITTSPADVEVLMRVESIKEDTVPVEDTVRVTGLPEGVTHSVSLDKNYVRVRGPGREVAKLESIPVRPVQLADIAPELDQQIQRHVPLSLEIPEGIKRIDATPVYATITVAPVSRPREVSLPVHVIAPPDFFETYQVTITPSVVPITVRGPQNLLEVLDADQVLRAVVDVTSGLEPDQPKRLPVKVLGPSWLTPEGSQALVRISLRRDPTEQPSLREDGGIKETQDNGDAVPVDSGDALPVDDASP